MVWKRRVNVAELVHGEEWLGPGGEIRIVLVYFEYRFVDFLRGGPRKPATR